MSRVPLVASFAISLALAGCHRGAPTETVGPDRVVATPPIDDVLAAIASALPPLPTPATDVVATGPAPEPWASGDPAIDAAIVAGTYIAFDVGNVRVRLPAADAVLVPYVRDLVERAGPALARRYGAVPGAVGIDYYPDRASFVARLGGRLPFDVDGAYGHGVVVAVSPSAGAGNWGETLVHELAHVYQDAAAPGGDAAWLREGFAEFDTSRVRPEWHREFDDALVAALGCAPEHALERIAREVDRPGSARSLGGAYAAAAEFAAFLDRTQGDDVAARLFAELARDRSVDAALTHVAGASLASLGVAFVDDLGPRLRATRRAHSFLASLDADRCAPAAPAAAALLEGRIDAARAAADAALAADPGDAVALEVRLRVALADGDARAEDLLARLATGETPVFEPSLALARVALLRGDRRVAEREARRAVAADPERVEGWDLLLRLADAGVGSIERGPAVDALVRVDQRARDLLLQRIDELAADGDAQRAFALAEQALYVAPQERSVHAVLADGYAARGDTAAAACEADVLRALDARRGAP